MSEHAGTCRACGAPILWASMPSGRANPLNAAEVRPEVGKGVVAINPNTGRGMPVTFAVIAQCGEWAQKHGVTFHLSHWADCPYAEAFRSREAV